MSETPTYKRIIEERLSHEIFSNDYLVKDSATEGTTRILISEFIDLVLADSPTEEDLAKILNDLAPEFSTQYSYTSGNIVTYQEQLYEFTASKPAGNWDSSKATQKSVSQLIADVKTRIDNEATARQNMDSQLASGIGQQMSNLADFYDTTKSYVVGDVCVLQSGELMRCIAPTSGTFDNTKWEQVTVDELFDDLNFSAEAISYDNTSSGLEAENVQDAIDEVVADVDAVETALETKAEQSGVYDDLVAGNLFSDSYTADNAPYLYRQSPSASSVEQNIVGGTVAWNQLVQNGNFADTSGWTTFRSTLTVANNIGTITLPSSGSVGSASINQSVSITKDHVVMATWEAKSNNNSMQIYFDGSSGLTTKAITSSWGSYGSINKITVANNAKFYIYPNSVNDCVLDIKNVNIIDLTQMFGSTIADYIYSLEQATAGSGIAWLKANGFLTKDYYPYDSGSLQSVKTSSRVTVGFNQWDEEWEVASIDANTGVKAPYPNRIASKNYIPCSPNTQYYIYSGSDYGQLRVCFYDVDKRFISSQSQITWNQTITTPSGAKYMLFCNLVKDVTTYNNDICINISNASKNGTYEPYIKHTYSLDSDLTLRGIPKLDSNNNLYYDGDIYKSDGSVKRRFGIVDLGTVNWSKDPQSRWFGLSSPIYDIPNKKPISSNDQIANIICPKYTTTTRNLITSGDGICQNTSNSILIADSYMLANYTEEQFKTAMSGVYLVYELATPTSETADSYENPQLVGSTEEFIDTRDVPIPVGGERKYHTDLKAKLEELAKIPDVPSTNGTYTLKATRSVSGVTYAWVSD